MIFKYHVQQKLFYVSTILDFPYMFVSITKE